MQGGLYIAVFHLAKTQWIRVGKLGDFLFRRGIYLYVGSARRGLRARIERHARRDKPLRWHIDYMSVRADMIGAILIAGEQRGECDVASQVEQAFELAVPHFGASDCRCDGHLFYAEQI